jgi:hypothetical protein
MKKIFLFFVILSTLIFSQDNKFQRFDFLIGKWSGTGSGFGNSKSKIDAEFKFVMDHKFIEVSHDSKFEPTENKPNGEHHVDKGYISYDANRDKFIFRQFFVEGYTIKYVLDETLSNESQMVFLSEEIENFIAGGKTRWVISRKSANEIVTTFDVSLPRKAYQCFGENRLKRVSK